MKKMFLGAMLFLSGFIGASVIVVISIFKPWQYNGIGGIGGFLLGTNTTFPLTVCCLLSIVGLVISFIEAYKKE